MNEYTQLERVIEEQQKLVEQFMKLYYIRCYKMPYPKDLDEVIMQTIDSFNNNQIKFLTKFSQIGEVRMSISKVQASWLKMILAINSMNTDRVVSLNSELLEEVGNLRQCILAQLYTVRELKAM